MYTLCIVSTCYCKYTYLLLFSSFRYGHLVSVTVIVSLCLRQCHYVCVTVIVSLCLCQCHCDRLSITVSVSLTLCQCHCVCASVTVFVSVSLCLCQCHCICVSVTVFASVSLCQCQCYCDRVTVSVSVSLCLYALRVRNYTDCSGMIFITSLLYFIYSKGKHVICLRIKTVHAEEHITPNVI